MQGTDTIMTDNPTGKYIPTSGVGNQHIVDGTIRWYECADAPDGGSSDSDRSYVDLYSSISSLIYWTVVNDGRAADEFMDNDDGTICMKVYGTGNSLLDDTELTSKGMVGAYTIMTDNPSGGPIQWAKYEKPIIKWHKCDDAPDGCPSGTSGIDAGRVDTYNSANPGSDGIDDEIYWQFIDDENDGYTWVLGANKGMDEGPSPGNTQGPCIMICNTGNGLIDGQKLYSKGMIGANVIRTNNPTGASLTWSKYDPNNKVQWSAVDCIGAPPGADVDVPVVPGCDGEDPLTGQTSCANCAGLAFVPSMKICSGCKPPEAGGAPLTPANVGSLVPRAPPRAQWCYNADDDIRCDILGASLCTSKMAMCEWIARDKQCRPKYV